MSTLSSLKAVPSATSCSGIERAAAVPRRTIADVHRFLTTVQPLLEELDTPAARFNGLYTDITARVGRWHDTGRFRSPAFVEELDVRFADRYVRAILGWLHDDGTALSSWLLVFEPAERTASMIVPATLGVNAHINADLTFALLATYRSLGLDLRDHTAEHRDYRAVNRIFHEAVPSLRTALNGLAGTGRPGPGPLSGWAEVLTDDVEDWFADLVIDSTRDQAWAAARRFWPHRDDEVYLRRHEEILDYVASTLGMLIDTPVGRQLLSA